MSMCLFPPFEASRFESVGAPSVSLELLSIEHVPDLIRAVTSGVEPLTGREIWHNPYTRVPKPIAMKGFVDAALRDVAMGTTRAFVIRWQHANQNCIVGTTRFFFYNLQHKRVQIGGTWLAAHARRTGVNHAVKQLMLREAFDVMNVQRVEFAIHPDNVISRRAVENMGAVQEGVLRKHVFMDGEPRDSVMYSLLDEEWQSCRLGS